MRRQTVLEIGNAHKAGEEKGHTDVTYTSIPFGVIIIYFFISTAGFIEGL